MPTLLACLVGAVVATATVDVIAPDSGTRTRAAAELGVFISVAYVVRRQLHRLRDGVDD